MITLLFLARRLTVFYASMKGCLVAMEFHTAKKKQKLLPVSN